MPGAGCAQQGAAGGLGVAGSAPTSHTQAPQAHSTAPAWLPGPSSSLSMFLTGKLRGKPAVSQTHLPIGKLHLPQPGMKEKEKQHEAFWM